MDRVLQVSLELSDLTGFATENADSVSTMTQWYVGADESEV